MKLVLGLMSLSIVGCSHLIYVNPTGENVIKVTFEDFTQAAHYQSMAVYEDDYDCYGSKSLANFSAAKTQRQFNVLPKKYLSFGYTNSLTGLAMTYCTGLYTFPIDGVKELLIQTNMKNSECSFSVSKKSSADAQQWDPVLDIVKRQVTVPMFDNRGPWCKPDNLFQGSSLLKIPRKS